MIRSTLPLAVCFALMGMVASDLRAQDSDKASNSISIAHASGSVSAQAKLPDWSGQWEIIGSTPSATGGFQQSLDEAVGAVRQWGPPPYRPAIRALVTPLDAVLEQGNQETRKNGPSGVTMPACTFGYPLLMLFSPLMFEVLPTPKETVLIFSAREVRHVYTDGRPHTAKEDLWPTYWGDSIGHWEGQTLVIDTIAVQSTIQGPESPFIPIVAFGGDANEYRLIALLSRQAHFVERIRMIADQLEDRMTIIDPVAFSTPWHISRTYRRVAHVHRMIYEDCGGEDRNPIVNGRYTLSPPPPPPAAPPPALAALFEAFSESAPRK
jgi:hypothetical protein